jgi:hypothetical protein
MDTNTAIVAIEFRLEKLDDVRSTEQFIIWQRSTSNTLLNIYGESDKRVKTFDEIRSINVYFDSRIERLEKAIEESREILKNLIQDLMDFGIPKKNGNSKNDSQIQLTVNQNNNQTQSTNIEIQFDFIVDILKDELKGSQLKEILAILNSSENNIQKKERLVDKIKSFGSDVASNILGNLLANPTFYEVLYNQLNKG